MVPVLMLLNKLNFFIGAGAGAGDKIPGADKKLTGSATLVVIVLFICSCTVHPHMPDNFISVEWNNYFYLDIFLYVK